MILDAVSGPASFELTVWSAPISLATCSLESSKSTQTILALVIAFAICIPIRPSPLRR